MKTKYQVQTGGKLYLAGEYAVLTPGYGAVIQFIPIYLSATIQESRSYQLASDLFGYQVDLTPNKDYALIQETIRLMEEWLKDQGIAPKPFDLHLRGTLGEEGKKYGIGSSGSVVLLVIKAMAALYELDLSPDLLFRLAAVVLVQRGDNGSMGDLACIAFEDLIYYQSFDRAWLHEVLTSQPLSQVLDLDWDYQICSIQPAIAYDFLFGIFFSPVFDNRDIGIGLSLYRFSIHVWCAPSFSNAWAMVSASRESLTRAITQPPRPPPLILAPKAPFSRATATR